MPDYATLAEKKNQLIRKALDGSLFCAPYTATAITALTDTTAGTEGELLALPTGYEDGGLMTDEGMRFGRTVETSDITSFGRVEPTRSDTNSDVATIQVDFQELKLHTINLYTGAQLTAASRDAASGEVQVPKPARPVARYYRLLALAVDENDGGEIYVAKFFPRAKTTDYSEQAFAKGDTAINWGMTFTAYVDETLGYSQMDIFGGPGWMTLLEDAGFTALA